MALVPLHMQESDYLSVVFHLYDSDDSDDEKMQGGMPELQNEEIRLFKDQGQTTGFFVFLSLFSFYTTQGHSTFISAVLKG